MSESKEWIVRFPATGNATDSRTSDFSKYLGAGGDEIVAAFHEQIERFIGETPHRLALATIVGYCKSGIPPFMEFIACRAKAYERQLGLSEITTELIVDYLAHLKASHMSAKSQMNRFKQLKAILRALGRRGLVRDDGLFPENPFPRIWATGGGAAPYSPNERKGVAQALRTRLQPLFAEPEPDVTKELLAAALLVISLRTGRNLTPLIEMELDCLRPHFKPGMKVLVLQKRRARRASRVAVRESSLDESSVGVLPETTRLIERVMALTEPLRRKAGALSERLWIYPAGRDVKALSAAHVKAFSTRMVADFELRDDNGKPLVVNVSRARKTFVNRVFELSKQDISIAASAAGHSVRVAQDNYLVPGEGAEVAWKFMGEALSRDLLSNAPSSESTPVGKCRDSKLGEFAPKNGEECTNFLQCFRCRSYVVTGEDLYKLYSFYWLVVRQMAASPPRWRAKFSHIVRIIDRDIAESGVLRKIFDQKTVDLARESARDNPHPFWASTTALEES